MASGIGTVEIRREHGKVTVLGKGSTPRGTQFIREKESLEVERISDKAFKDEMAAAVEKLLG